MSKFHWDRLPPEHYKEFVEAVFDDFKKKVLEFHEEYKLTDYNYKCCDLSYLLIHAKQAIKDGKFRIQKETD